jgi:hypothetical protein
MNKLVVHESEETTSGLPIGYEGPGVGSLAVSLARAEIDQQILTARAMPRSISRSVGNIMTLATLDEASAEECIYALPRAGKAIKGPSIRLAEIIASQYGNCRVGARVVHVDRYEKFVEAEGVFHDLETNTATTSRVRRRISNKRGDLLQEDMIIVTGNAACAIAKRNAILGGVPKAVWRKAYDAVESVIAGDVKTLAERRPMALKAFAAFGVKPEQIFDALGVAGLDDITLDHMATLTGMRSSLKSGESTVEEMFPVKPAPSNRPDLKTSLDKLADVPAEEPIDTPPPAAAEDQSRPAPSEAPEPAGPGVSATVPAEATPQGPLEGAAASPPGAAVPSDAEADRKARVAEIRKDGDARAAAGTAALADFLEDLRKAGEADLVSEVVRSAWRDDANVADARRKA